MEAISLLLNKTHLLCQTQQRFILIVPYNYKQKYFAFVIKENGRILNFLFSSSYAPHTYSLWMEHKFKCSMHCMVNVTYLNL